MGRVGEGDHVTNMVNMALDLGYRHIDTASNYGNEQSVGRALQESNVSRDEIFLTTKLASEDHGNVELALNQSLKKLGTDYVDLYLMHWPMTLLENGHALQPDESPTFVETWKSMEKLLDSGKVKNIGVSNFGIKTLTTLLKHARIVPAVNQVEAHPCLPQHELLAFCSSHEPKILLTAYSPVGKHKYATSDRDIVDIARNKGTGVKEGQVLLSWAVQRGTAVMPKSVDPTRLKQNLSLIELTPDEMHRLDEIHLKPGMHRSVCGFHSSDLGGSCFGWTYEQLGWDMAEGGIAKPSNA